MHDTAHKVWMFRSTPNFDACIWITGRDTRSAAQEENLPHGVQEQAFFTIAFLPQQKEGLQVIVISVRPRE